MLNLVVAESFSLEMTSNGCRPKEFTFRVVDGFCISGIVDKACEFLANMINQDIVPSVATFGQILNCLCMDNKVKQAVGVIQIMVRRGLVPEVVNSIFKANKREVAAPKILVEELLKKGHITYYAYEIH